MIEFLVPGVPVAKARARTVRSPHGAVHTFTPDRTAAHERSVAIYARRACKRPLAGPLRLEVTFFLPIAKSAPKARREASARGLLRPCVKPDTDNLLKLVLDAGNGILWQDDKSVVELEASKHYSEQPRTIVRVCEVSSVVQWQPGA